MSGVGKLTVGALISGFLVAVLLLPYAAGMAWTSTQVVNAVDSAAADPMDGDFPERSTMVDINGDPIAIFYTQNRVYKPLTEISDYLKWAVISMEDRRFYLHPGVDWRSTSRALIKDFGGASTLTQQYVKNYKLLVEATTDTERAEAIAPTPIRKLREAKAAITIEKEHNNKNYILERYLNLVGFGTATYGAEAAAQYYFNTSAAKLTLPQAALLAGMLQNPTKYNPLNRATAVAAKSRRNVVLDAMLREGRITPKQNEEAKLASISIRPNNTANGCYSAPNASAQGYYCQYVLDYLASRPKDPITRAQLEVGGYTIYTNMDPNAMKAAKDSVDNNANPDEAKRVANAIAVIEPGKTSRKVLALVANRPYGNDEAKGQTLQRLTTTFAPLGAGSIFKVFTAAAALEKGLGTDSVLNVPKTYSSIINTGSRDITNSGNYPEQMTLKQALATSPNTPFVSLEESIGLKDVADMAVRLGLRGYELPAGEVESAFSDMTGTYADQVSAQKMVSFTLGVTPVSPAELSNVGATIASSGMWCPPSPVERLADRTGTDVALSSPDCEQVVEPKLADTLAQAMEGDISLDQDGLVGTAHKAFTDAGWDSNRPVAGKTGTTQNYKSSAFLGFTPRYSAAVMTWDYQNGPRSICINPLRSCTNDEAQAGNGMSGGTVPARTWADAMKVISADAPSDPFPPESAEYVTGAGNSSVPDVINKTVAEAKEALADKGFQVPDDLTYVNSVLPTNTVVDQDPKDSALPGSVINLFVSKGPQSSNAGG